MPGRRPPCSMDGWLYPTYPPLTKGRKQTPLLSGCSLLLAVPFVNELLNLYNPRPRSGIQRRFFVFVLCRGRIHAARLSLTRDGAATESVTTREESGGPGPFVRGG